MKNQVSGTQSSTVVSAQQRAVPVLRVLERWAGSVLLQPLDLFQQLLRVVDAQKPRVHQFLEMSAMWESAFSE